MPPFNVICISSSPEHAEFHLYDGKSLVKKVTRSQQSIINLTRMVKYWYKDKKLPPTVNNTIASIEEYFKVLLAEVGADSFAFKYFFSLYDLSGKVAIVTGSSSGIGKQNAYQLADMGAHVILANRSEEKTRPIMADIKEKTKNENVEFIQLDLHSLESVNHFVDTFRAKNIPLHILINNAASIVDGMTSYGIDSSFGIMHVGPFLLTMRLLDIIKKTEKSRIVFVASQVAFRADGLPFEKIRQGIPLRFYNSMNMYSYAKLANVLTVKKLAKLFAREAEEEGKKEGNCTPRVYAVHPGVVATDIWRQLPNFVSALIKKFMKHEEEGSLMTLYCAVDAGCESNSGSYFDITDGGKVSVQIPLSEDEALQELCWAESIKMCNLPAVEVPDEDVPKSG